MQDRVLTAKGSKQADAVLEAAIRCLGEDGYAATSLQRVADAAGVQKRMVLYYYDSRERLIAAAFARLADRFLADVRDRLDGLHDPAAVIDALVELMLAQDRGLVAAYFGLVGEAATDATLAAALAEFRTRELALANAVIDDLEAHGHELSLERDLLILAARTVAHGVGMELLEHGRTPAFERALTLARAGAPMLLFD
ncbi:MAG TPA: TetR family transcriptional regulator [Solirubrobacteraceae bacterium]